MLAIGALLNTMCVFEQYEFDDLGTPVIAEQPSLFAPSLD